VERLKGHFIGRPLYRKPGSDFGVFDFRPETPAGDEGKLRVVGPVMPSIDGSQLVELFGEWESSEKWGRQLVVSSVQPVIAAGVEGLVTYLALQVPGIGKKWARVLGEAFGDQLEHVLENDPERLYSVKSLGTKRAKSIMESWHEDALNRRLVTFLVSIGLSPSYRESIREAFGDKAESIIRKNPFRLISIHGIGFKRADEIAAQLGFGKDSEDRAQCVIHYLLERGANNGHLFLTRSELLEQCANECQSSVQGMNKVLDQMLREGVNYLKEDVVKVREIPISCIYLQHYYNAEHEVAQEIHRLRTSKMAHRFEPSRVLRAIENAEKQMQIQLSGEQRYAIQLALSEPVLIVTGGPGCGKTTLLRVLVRVTHELQLDCLLAAPTGRAAKRMNEVTDEPAATIHRLLEYSKRSGFQRGRFNPLDGDMVVVDEFSMVDIKLAAALLVAIPKGCPLLIIGDPDQLPSVGPGRVLADFLVSKRIPSVRLTQIFRQAKQSLIVQQAHAILNGYAPQFHPDPQGLEGALTYDAYYIEAPMAEPRTVDYEGVKARLSFMMTERIPAKLPVDPIRDIQVLIPQKKHAGGVFEMNRYLQEILNPQPEENRRMVGGREYRIGDRVMVTKNNAELDIWNGDIGFIKAFDLQDKGILIDFYGRVVAYPYAKAASLHLAYASTIHKSQGGEFKVVILVLLQAHFMMLQRKLLYTAVSRAKELLLYICQGSALHAAVRNVSADERNSLLARHLRSLLPPLPKREKENAA
jgi:exodeoxyribonuclease V alpha subunit